MLARGLLRTQLTPHATGQSSRGRGPQLGVERGAGAALSGEKQEGRKAGAAVLFQEGNLLTATVWESRSARPGSSPPPPSAGSEASTSEAGREEVNAHRSSCGSRRPRCPILRADGNLHAPELETGLRGGEGAGAGWVGAAQGASSRTWPEFLQDTLFPDSSPR